MRTGSMPWAPNIYDVYYFRLRLSLSRSLGACQQVAHKFRNFLDLSFNLGIILFLVWLFILHTLHPLTSSPPRPRPSSSLALLHARPNFYLLSYLPSPPFSHAFPLFHPSSCPLNAPLFLHTPPLSINLLFPPNYTLPLLLYSAPPIYIPLTPSFP
jgi:hypothetical protein